jgi:2-polyprenyl-3-methyl-5-hydroxy-6-metoxy-1,4-benzoquinol methylase
MNDFTENSDLHRRLAETYFCDESSRVWARPHYCGINYSDGDSIEDKLLEILKNTGELSVLSSELRNHCTDWPSLYHLSTSRANILRPHRKNLVGDILEIGAGCGAITRFLGECGANVLALEGSPRRAIIARERTRDQKNVSILAERFSDLQLQMSFDVVTLIGVLEYANLFTEAPNPPLAMLKKVRGLLKPNGILVIAIENQLGLKYFSGANEDHMGQPMLGIEGHYSSKTARTFGRLELERLLVEAGFPVCEFMACFPDYKLPSSIITSAGLSNPRFNAGALASQSVAKDHLKPDYFCFSPELVWPIVAKNGLGLDLANSFLISAGTTDSAKSAHNILAYHYSSERLPKFTKETIFHSNLAGDISASYLNLSNCGPTTSASVALDQEQLKFDVPHVTAYSQGTPFYTEFCRIISNKGWTHSALKDFINSYLDALGKVGGLSSKPSPETKIDGRLIDCIPSNLIAKQDGTIEFIDTEWALSCEIPMYRLVFRALLNITFMLSNFAPDEFETKHTYGDFFKLCFKLINFDVDNSKLVELFKDEIKFQKAVGGHSTSDEQIEKLLVAPLPDKKYYSIIPAYQQQSEQLQVEISRLSHEMAASQHRLADLSQELSSIKLSIKWRLLVGLSEITPIFIKRLAHWVVRSIFRTKQRQ